LDRRLLRKLETLGIHTIGDLAHADPSWLVEQFGRHTGAWMYEAAQGHDDRPVVTHSEPKSISRETTLDRDLSATRDRAELSQIFTDLCVSVADDLIRAGYAGRTIGLKLRYDNFRTVTRDQNDSRADAGRAYHPPHGGRVSEARSARAANPATRRAHRRADPDRRGGRDVHTRGGRSHTVAVLKRHSA
jgi:nucleotidyltransferase/DNA polymerase involved in DNA repair